VSFTLHEGDVLDAYPDWPQPAAIISDGAYGVGGFPGDPRSVRDLAEWYWPHVAAWSKSARPATVLWFWGTELSWATVHFELDAQGWDYVQTVVWDKGVRHIAGKVNSLTVRTFPVVTEVCVLYQRRFDRRGRSAQEWFRDEWRRSGLPMAQANEACGVRSAATRKYLSSDHQWYFPPGEMVERLAAHCNAHGDPAGRPYFAVTDADEAAMRSVNAAEWDALRYRWNHVHGMTNVWAHPPLHSSERFRGSMRRSAPRAGSPTARSTTHLNQKPVELMRRIIAASTVVGDVIWEPFGGLCSASVAALELGRVPYAAERDEHFAALSRERLTAVTKEESHAR